MKYYAQKQQKSSKKLDRKKSEKKMLILKEMTKLELVLVDHTKKWFDPALEFLKDWGARFSIKLQIQVTFLKNGTKSLRVISDILRVLWMSEMTPRKPILKSYDLQIFWCEFG